MNTDKTLSTTLVPVSKECGSAGTSSELLFPIRPTTRSFEPEEKRRIDIRSYLRDFFLAFLFGLFFFGAGAYAVVREILKILS